MNHPLDPQQLAQLAEQIKHWGMSLGFTELGISAPDLSEERQKFRTWLENQYHGEMGYLERNEALRFDPAELVPGTLRVISARMPWMPPEVETLRILESPDKAYIARYALGRDYHKVVRKRLAKLAKQIESEIGTFGYRAFVDSAPVLERPIAQQAGLGWRGKHTLLLNRKSGSFFVLGELLVDLPLPVDAPYERDHCGHCTACLDACPTRAFPAPYVLDARRCISYLTIELKGPIPLELRPLIGNRVFGCDDCQLACPYNRRFETTDEADFHPRHQLDTLDLIALFAWDEETFLKRTEGSPIRRSGYDGWLRNLAIGLGNSAGGQPAIDALRARADHPSELVREHVHWALERLSSDAPAARPPLLRQGERKLKHLR